MAKIVIEVPDDCRKCPCFIKAEAKVGPDEKTFYLCQGIFPDTGNWREWLWQRERSTQMCGM